jgi:dienelactone hydrolase
MCRIHRIIRSFAKRRSLQDRSMARLGILILALLLAGVTARADVPYTSALVSFTSTTDGKPQDIPAILLKPAGDGPFPAIVIVHDCSGLGPGSSGSPARWANLLAAEGYVVLMPDSFEPRGFANGVCFVTASGPQLRTTNPIQRAADAFAALAYLRRFAYVDGDHIGLMGGSHGGSTTLMTLVDAPNPLLPADVRKSPGFAAGIALYPGCGAAYGGWSVERQSGNRGPVIGYDGVYKPIAPLLILVGEKDDWTPAAHCQALAERAQAADYPVTIKIYPGAYHSFDSDKPPRYVDERRNANKRDGHGATTGGDPVAWKDAIERVKSFFGRYLKPGAVATP